MAGRVVVGAELAGQRRRCRRWTSAAAAAAVVTGSHEACACAPGDCRDPAEPVRPAGPPRAWRPRCRARGVLVLRGGALRGLPLGAADGLELVRAATPAAGPAAARRPAAVPPRTRHAGRPARRGAAGERVGGVRRRGCDGQRLRSALGPASGCVGCTGGSGCVGSALGGAGRPAGVWPLRGAVAPGCWSSWGALLRSTDPISTRLALWRPLHVPGNCLRVMSGGRAASRRSGSAADRAARTSAASARRSARRPVPVDPHLDHAQARTRRGERLTQAADVARRRVAHAVPGAERSEVGAVRGARTPARTCPRARERPCSRVAKIEPPSSLTTTTCRCTARLERPPQQTADVVQERQVAEQGSDRPRAGAAPSATPTAVETVPSIPARPRFASDDGRRRASAATRSRSRTGLLDPTTSTSSGGLARATSARASAGPVDARCRCASRRPAASHVEHCRRSARPRGRCAAAGPRQSEPRRPVRGPPPAEPGGGRRRARRARCARRQASRHRAARRPRPRRPREPSSVWTGRDSVGRPSTTTWRTCAAERRVRRAARR